MSQDICDAIAVAFGGDVDETISSAIRDGFCYGGPNIDQNIVDATVDLAIEVGRVASAILPVAMPGHDETGGTVLSLTESVMGITAALCKIADSISDLAAAVRENQ